MLNHDFRRLYLYYSLPPTLSIIENKIKKKRERFSCAQLWNECVDKNYTRHLDDCDRWNESTKIFLFTWSIMQKCNCS